AGGHIVGAVVDAPEPGGLAASCLAELAWRIPSPTRPAAPQAYVSSVSTDPRWRRRGFARAALALLLAELGDRGVRRVELHATPDGTALYESLGFVPRTGGKSYLLELDGV
ncbi:MAG: GNAT family N-acetyltransferase, partial [Acidimicrobiales bacterium]